MKIDIVTIFPKMFETSLNESLLKKARENGLIKIDVHDLRKYTSDPHRQVDDTPYGGGVGMVMKPEPFFEAVPDILKCPLEKVKEVARVIIFTPRGGVLNQEKVVELSGAKRIVLLCGRYEGIDERVAEHLATDEISLGDFILAGGELPAMVLTEAISRFVPGVVGKVESVKQESFVDGLLEHPHYTRPGNYRGLNVPDVLLSGDHKKIKAWRRKKSLEDTYRRRPKLLENAELNDNDREWLTEIGEEQ